MCSDVCAKRQQVTLDAPWALQLPLHAIMSGKWEREADDERNITSWKSALKSRMKKDKKKEKEKGVCTADKMCKLLSLERKKARKKTRKQERKKDSRSQQGLLTLFTGLSGSEFQKFNLLHTLPVKTDISHPISTAPLICVQINTSRLRNEWNLSESDIYILFLPDKLLQDYSVYLLEFM